MGEPIASWKGAISALRRRTTMNRILTTAVAGAAVIGVAAAVPTQASANPVVIAPALLALALGGAVVGGAVVGSAATNAQHPQGRVLVTSDNGPVPADGAQVADGAQAADATPAPTGAAPGCRPDRAKIHGVWHNIQICD
jgi:hypothetical protein